MIGFLPQTDTQPVTLSFGTGWMQVWFTVDGAVPSDVVVCEEMALALRLPAEAVLALALPAEQALGLALPAEPALRLEC